MERQTCGDDTDFGYEAYNYNFTGTLNLAILLLCKTVAYRLLINVNFNKKCCHYHSVQIYYRWKVNSSKTHPSYQHLKKNKSLISPVVTFRAGIITIQFILSVGAVWPSVTKGTPANAPVYTFSILSTTEWTFRAWTVKLIRTISTIHNLIAVTLSVVAAGVGLRSVIKFMLWHQQIHFRLTAQLVAYLNPIIVNSFGWYFLKSIYHRNKTEIAKNENL